ncbi:hypothetical protein AQUCO_00300325v1 [Aquilegia coerulea]|uniref:Bifunctional inhibitor/plant lipid transfer protein/seed storage helical domain-containing protein n=1 Tax=Aquilegia coerulea TaxID=218851 RepID=A0A2G5EYC8_AQUCA|nr:hypothetical protein AQUCO_00300325v1 [Aquilegia coerulea]
MSKVSYLLVTIMIFACLVSDHKVSAKIKHCDDDLLTFLNRCADYIGKGDPNPIPSPSYKAECCRVINYMDIPCICDDKQVEMVISKKRMVDICGQCGKPFAHGSKCGSYTVPL